MDSASTTGGVTSSKAAHSCTPSTLLIDLMPYN